MAKRKTPKAEMPKKLTHTELNNAQGLVETMTRLQLQIGRIETEKQAIFTKLSAVQEVVDKVQKDMVAKYGTNDIDLKTGKINYKANPNDDKTN